MDVSILIVNWNVRDLLALCLDSLYREEHSFSFEVWVVDNASTDGSVEMLQELYPQVQLIQNKSNVGFALGNIQAYEHSNGNNILLLNPDTALETGALDRLYSFMQEHPQVGAVGPDLRNPDGTRQMGCYPFPTLSREFWRLFHLDSLRAYGVYPVEQWDTSTPREVDVIQGACLLLRRAALDACGFLDADYYMYTEEVDLCYRLKKGGWQIFWLPNVRVVHYGGQSTHQAAELMFIKLYESKTLFFRKQYGNLVAFFYKAILFSAAVFRIGLSPLAWLLKPGKRSETQAIAHNYRQLLAALPGY
jgi:GT2 family glycosyltransferase